MDLHVQGVGVACGLSPLSDDRFNGVWTIREQQQIGGRDLYAPVSCSINSGDGILFAVKENNDTDVWPGHRGDTTHLQRALRLVGIQVVVGRENSDGNAALAAIDVDRFSTYHRRAVGIIHRDGEWIIALCQGGEIACWQRGFPTAVAHHLGVVGFRSQRNCHYLPRRDIHGLARERLVQLQLGGIKDVVPRYRIDTHLRTGEVSGEVSLPGRDVARHIDDLILHGIGLAIL